MTPSPSVVIVEDDLLIRMLLEQFCVEAGVRVAGMATRAAEAVEKIRLERPTHLVLDYRLAGDRTGLDILEEVRPFLDNVSVIFLTASTESPTLAMLEKAEPNAILIKPVAKNRFIEALLEGV